ncbi:MAG: hypothetical protein J1E96_04685 [Ruminococcus sp.]|nr:hypothetical protein [Ruminococcus sp.]
MEDFEKLEQSAEETVSEEIVNEEIVNNDDTENTVEETVYVNENDIPEETVSEQTDAPEKPKKLVQTPIIIAAGVLLAAILAFACFKVFFNNSVVGTWYVATETAEDGATPDEVDPATLEYYTFEKDGTASITLGTMKVIGTWNYATDDDSTTDQTASKINIAISYFVNGTFDVELDGNAIFGKTMTLSNEYMTTPVKFESGSVPKSNLKPSEDFEPNDRIVGTWQDSGQSQVFTFNADGTCSLNQMDVMVVDGIYTVDEKSNIIKITYLRPDENEMDIDFDASGDDESKLTMLGLEYEKVEE